MKRNIQYVIQKEGKYYVSRCLNVEVSSFGESVEEAVDNLKEALELYFEEDNNPESFLKLDEVILGESVIDV